MAVGKSFSRELLKNCGWKDGKGLGKEENGIVTSIKPKLKFCKGGLGYKISKDLTDHWWDSFYNTSVNNISVSKSDDGKIKIKMNDNVSSRKAVTSKSYSSFVSGGSLVGLNITKSKKKKKNKPPQQSSILLDESQMKNIKTISKTKKKRLFGKLGRLHLQEQKVEKEANMKKGVSFSKKLISFRIFHKKKSILQDFGRLTTVKNAFTNNLSCLKKRSAYSPTKKMLIDCKPLLENNYGQLGSNKQKKKYNCSKISFATSRKDTNYIMKKVKSHSPLSQLTTDTKSFPVFNRNGKKKSKKLKKNKRKRNIISSHEMSNVTDCVEKSPILSKKLKRKNDSFMNIICKNDSEERNNLILSNSTNDETVNRKRKLSISTYSDELSACYKKVKVTSKEDVPVTNGKRKKMNKKKRMKFIA